MQIDLKYFKHKKRKIQRRNYYSKCHSVVGPENQELIHTDFLTKLNITNGEIYI